MKAITIIQPWATLVAIGEKDNETRGWATKYRGPLAIHAGKKVDKEACLREPIRSVLEEHGYTADNLPTGAIVAIANLIDCKQVLYDMGDHAVMTDASIVGDNEYSFGNYEDGRYAWRLTDRKYLEDPIPAKGQQGLWNWEGNNP